MGHPNAVRLLLQVFAEHPKICGTRRCSTYNVFHNFNVTCSSLFSCSWSPSGIDITIAVRILPTPKVHPHRLAGYWDYALALIQLDPLIMKLILPMGRPNAVRLRLQALLRYCHPKDVAFSLEGCCSTDITSLVNFNLTQPFQFMCWTRPFKFSLPHLFAGQVHSRLASSKTGLLVHMDVTLITITGRHRKAQLIISHDSGGLKSANPGTTLSEDRA